MKTLVLILALAIVNSNQSNNHRFFKYVGQEVTKAEIQEILGSDFTENGTTFTKDGITIRLDSYQYKRTTPILEIEEIWLSKTYLAGKANKQDPFMGLTLKMTREECVEHMKTLPDLKQVTAGSDMYGSNIRAYYTGNPKAPQYHGLYVFMRFEKGKKRRLYLSSITIKDRGKI